MLTARLGRLRDGALFGAAALAPALVMGALGLRALANEEAGARREVALGLGAEATALAREIEQGITLAATQLEAATVEADTPRAQATLARTAPRFATPVLLAADRSLLVPPAPDAPRLEAAPDARAPVPNRCGELAALLRGPAPSEEATIADARRELLRGCPEVRSPSGRFLWPVLALDPESHGLVPDDAVATWIVAHAARLSEPEREATRRDAERALASGPRERAATALTTSWSRRDALLAAISSQGAAAALRARPTAGGVARWRTGASAGALRRLDDGRLAGFVVDAGALERALASGVFALPASMRPVVVQGASARVADALEGKLVSVAPVASELAVRIEPADPAAVARNASKSRRILAGIGAFGVCAAFGLAWVLFARMRAARRSSALRTDFVAAVSHELRTPIASMRMLAELLEEDRVDAAEQPEVFVALAREARRLGETVDRLLGFSRMAAGRYVVDRAEAPVAPVVAASIDTFEERHPDVPRVVRDLDEEALAPIDAGQVRLAVDNLLANARKYAPEGTPYRVTVRRERGGVVVTVADRGPGIARRDRKRIFEPFERADDRLSRATEGSGIGLSLVRHVARAHGGRAWVESELGRGAAFTLWIPAAEGRGVR